VRPSTRENDWVRYTEYDTRLAAYAVILDDLDRVLLALWNEAPEPLWTMPGGGVELHETIEQALVREVKEETGYDVQPGRILGVNTQVFGVMDREVDTERALKAVRIIYEATIIGGELTHEVGGTTDEARWFPLEDVPQIARVPMVDVALRMRAFA
jgi:8-oxo-dGTP diphosphatase